MRMRKLCESSQILIEFPFLDDVYISGGVGRWVSQKSGKSGIAGKSFLE